MKPRPCYSFNENPLPTQKAEFNQSSFKRPVLAFGFVMMIQQPIPSRPQRRKSSVRGGRHLAVGKNGKDKGKEKSVGKIKKSSSKSSRKGKKPETSDRTTDVDNIFDHSLNSVSTEQGFVTFCQSSLLSYGRASDGLISQNDAASLISETCTMFDHADIPTLNCPSPRFDDLDIDIKLNFVSYICPVDSEMNIMSCLSNLSVQQQEFGYSISENGVEQSIEYVKGFCCSLLPLLQGTGIEPLGPESSVCPSAHSPLPEQPDFPPANAEAGIFDETGLPSGSYPTYQPIELPVLDGRGINSNEEIPTTLSIAGTISIILAITILMLSMCCFVNSRKKSEKR